MLMTIKRKLISIVFALALVISLLPVVTMQASAYTAPTALEVAFITPPNTGTDQSANCHDYKDYITNVTFAEIDNSSDGTYSGGVWHTDYGRTPTQVAPGDIVIGQSYTLSVTISGEDLSWSYLAVYIDWNGDHDNGTTTGLSLDTGEEVAEWYGSTETGSPATKTFTKTVTVPSYAVTGNIYMRVMLDADTPNATDNTGDYQCYVLAGEIEDYVLNVSAAGPSITSATYNASTGVLAVTGSGMTLGDTIDVSKLTLTGEGGSTYTLTTGNVNATSATDFSLTLNDDDKAAVNHILNKNGTSSTSGTNYNLAAADDWDSDVTAGDTSDATGNGITVSNVAVPTITSATYDASTGALVVTGTGLLSLSGANNDIVANKFTLTGEGGATYTLTDTPNVEITSGTSFTLSLSATDKAAVNLILNKIGTSSTDISTYNLRADEDWAAGADSAVDVADTTGNGITVSNVATPTITSATYNASTGVLTVTGTGFLKLYGANNDIVANKFTLTGEGGATYTLTDTPNVEITSGTSFTIIFSATDKSAVNLILNKIGTSSTGGTIYNLAAAEDWAAGADSAVLVADTTGNGITVSNVAAPSITSATYDASTGSLVVTGTGFLKLAGATNDIDVSKFVLTGKDGATRTLTNSSDVEITNGTSFTITLSPEDKEAVNFILNKNGTSSTGETTYNLGAAEDWAAGADSNVVVADLNGNGILVSKVAPKVTITSATANPTNSSPFSVTITFSESVTGFEVGDITVTNGAASNLSGAGATYTADITPSGQGVVTVNVGAGVADSAGIGNTAAVELSRTFDSLVPDAPIISTLPQAINAGSITISGTAEAGATITITGGAATATGTAAGGNYSISVSLTQDSVNTLVVKATDAAGNNSATASVAITEDSTAPAAPTITTVTQTINADSITISGTAEAGATITITGGSATATGTATGGNYSISVSLTQDSVNTLVVKATDAAGNNSATASVAITEDSTAPAAPTITTATQTINADSITISGTAEAGATITITGGSATATGTAAGGNYSISVNLTQNAVNTLVVKATDTVGNESTTANVAITEDSVSPSVTTSANQTISTTAATNGATVCALTATDATAITGFTDALTWSKTGGANAADFSVVGSDLKIANAVGLVAGSYIVQVTATDVAGNTNAQTITVAVVIGPTVNAVSHSYTDTAANDTFGNSSDNISATPNSGSITGYGISGGIADTTHAGYTLSKAGTYGTLYVNDTTGAYVYVPTSDALLNAQTATVTDVFSITATDGAGTAGNSLTITINGVNDTPTDIALSATSVNENVAGNTTVGSLSSTDADAGNTFNYTLVAGVDSTDNASFNIDGSNLRITNSPNFETKSSYSVRVRTTDQGGLWFEKAFTITINDVNEAPTDIALSANSVNENVVADTVVGALSSTDVDATNTFTYTLAAGAGDADNASFNIFGSNLRVTNSPNYESKNSYSVRVRTTDQGGLWFEEAFTITINDVNEAPTDIGLSASAINENVAANTVVGALTSTDADAVNTFTYTLVSGADSTDNGAFNIDGNNLRITNSPNYEAKSSYSVRVRSTDQGGLWFEEAFTININNIDEVPVISTGDSISVVEGTTIAFTAAGSDPEGSPITWTISGGADAAKFSINAGVVTFGTAPSFGTPTDSDTNNTYVVQITANDGTLEASKTVTVTVTAAPVYDSPSTPATPANSAVVEVNGEKQDAGQTNTQTTGGTTTTTITVDDTKLDKILESKGNNATVTLPASGNPDVVVGQLTGQTVKNMETKEAVLEIKTQTVTYTLPASQINIDAVSSQLGAQVELKDIKVNVKIAEPPADTVKIVENTANKGNYQLVVKPVEFEITCTSGDTTVEVSRFNGYVERTIAIPDGIDPSKITTGIVLNSDGTFSHVPTSIVMIGGKYFAKINSLTNSTYSVIYNPVTFTDVASHWAKDAINDMGSRMVVTGIGGGIYEPERSITRAEFAAIVVRAMGLKKGTTESAFGDVALTDWFNGYVDTATAYSLITGYDNVSFAPNDTITREQAMAILARAMKLTGLSVTLTNSEASALLASYTDAGLISDYAKAGAAACIKTGVVSGTTASTLSPKDSVTRAEVAAMVQRLLQKSGLI